MPYCTAADIRSKLQHVTIDAESDPNETEVTAFITQIDADMDAQCNAAGVDLPITDSDKLLVVKPISVNGVAACVLRAIGMDLEREVVFQRLYDNAMKRIVQSPAILNETGVVNTGPEGSTRQPPTFRRDTVQW